VQVYICMRKLLAIENSSCNNEPLEHHYCPPVVMALEEPTEKGYDYSEILTSGKSDIRNPRKIQPTWSSFRLLCVNCTIPRVENRFCRNDKSYWEIKESSFQCRVEPSLLFNRKIPPVGSAWRPRHPDQPMKLIRKATVTAWHRLAADSFCKKK
jgi:hypothetical protein